MKLYAAHPITSLSYKEVMDYYHNLKMLLKESYEILCPMVTKGFLANEEQLNADGYTDPVITDHAIIERDHWMVCQSDVLFIDFTGSERVSIGCIMELAWSHENRKHTVIVLPPENIHKHAFVKQAADIVFDDFETAINYLRELAAGNIKQNNMLRKEVLYTPARPRL